MIIIFIFLQSVYGAVSIKWTNLFMNGHYISQQ